MGNPVLPTPSSAVCQWSPDMEIPACASMMHAHLDESLILIKRTFGGLSWHSLETIGKSFLFSQEVVQAKGLLCSHFVFKTCFAFHLSSPPVDAKVFSFCFAPKVAWNSMSVSLLADVTSVSCQPMACLGLKLTLAPRCSHAGAEGQSHSSWLPEQ